MAAGFGAGNNPKIAGNQPTNYNYIGSQELGELSLLEPEFFGNLIQRYGRQDLTGMISKMPGYVKRTSGASIIRHAEEDFIHGAIIGDTTAAGLAGAGVTVNIAAANVFEETQQAPPYVGTGTTDRVIPTVYDIVRFTNNVEGIVTAVDASAPSFTVYPLDGTDLIPAVVAGDKIVVTGSANPEASSARQSKSTRVIYYENYMMIHRNDHEITGTAAGEPIWIKVPDKQGRLQDRWYLKGISDTYHRHMNEREMMLLDGRVITNTAIPALSGFSTVQKTLGLVNTIEQAGNVEEYTADSLTLEDLDNLCFSFQRNKAPKRHLALMGIRLRKEINALVREGDGVDLWASGAGRLIFNQFNAVKKQGINLDMNFIEHLGFNFMITQPDVFSDPETLGAVDKFERLGIFVPIGTTTAYNWDNPETKVEVPTIALVEKTGFQGESSRGMREWITGYGMGAATSGDDKAEVHYLSHFGLETFAINRFGILKDSAS